MGSVFVQAASFSHSFPNNRPLHGGGLDENMTLCVCPQVTL